MLGLGYGDFLVEDVIFLMEKAKDFLRSRLGFSGDPMLNLISRCMGKNHLHVGDFMQLPIRDYVVDGDPILNLILRCMGKHHLHVGDFMQLPIQDLLLMAIPCLISYRGIWVNIICMLGTSCNYQFEIMLLKSSLAIMMV